MLSDKPAAPTIAVKDLARAKAFYGSTLGLTPLDTQGDEVISYKNGDSFILVYHSDYAGTNQATAMTWEVDDIEGTVKTLKSKGVHFEHYDMPGMTHQGDVHVDGNMKVAWFKDPDGNILCIGNTHPTH